MARRLVGVGAKSKVLTSPGPESVNLDKPYPMTSPQLGYVLVINNLASEIPETVTDVQSLTAVFDNIGLSVKSYNDCNAQGMQQIKNWLMKPEHHRDVNCLFLVLVCHGMEQGWLLDRYKKKVYKLDQLAAGLCAVPTLKGKPKVILIQEYKDSYNERIGDVPVQAGRQDLFIVCATYRSATPETEDASYLVNFANCLQEEYLNKTITQIAHAVKQSMKSQGQKQPLTDTELALLAPVISSMTMRNFAVKKLGLREAEVDTIIDACRENKELSNRQILVKWRNRSPSHDGQRLAELLLESAREGGQVDSNMVAQTFKLEQLVIHEFDTLTQQLDLSLFISPESPAQQKPGHAQPETELTSTVKELQEKINKLEAEKKSQETQPSVTIEGETQPKVPEIKLGDEFSAKAQLTERRVKMTLLSTLDADLQRWSDMTVMPETREVVVHGVRDRKDTPSLYIYWEEGGKWRWKKEKSPCRHPTLYLMAMMFDGAEQLAVSCAYCKDIKLMNIKTQNVNIVFTNREYKLGLMCAGGDSGKMYVCAGKTMVLELNCSARHFTLSRTLHPGVSPVYMCYLPVPYNALVVSTFSIIYTVSIDKDDIMWRVKGKVDGSTMLPRGVLFLPEHDLRLVCDGKNGRILVTEPSNGSHVQTIPMPDMGEIRDVRLCKDVIFMLHGGSSQCKISCLSVK